MEVKPQAVVVSSAGKRKLSLSQYVRRRTGVPMGAPGSLRKMLYRSLGSKSFAGFWQHWNPLFGYYLGKYIFSPLRRVVPRGVALLVTFVACGALHDLVTMAVRGSVAFLFTPWFFFLGVGVLFGHAVNMDLASRSWAVRAITNLTYLSVCLATVLILKGFFAAGLEN